MQANACLHPPSKYFRLLLTVTDVAENDIRAAASDEGCNAILVKQLSVQAEQAIRRALSVYILETVRDGFDE